MMPRSYSNVYTPTNGVRTDFKRLMNRFLSSATVRFEQFSEVWRALNMSYLCAGRNTDREAREFIEKILVIAREYFLPPYQFQVRVGGLYLMYAIYQIQPISPKAKIRLTPQQWNDALQFLQQAKQQSHLDVVYIFNRLIQEQAFQFCFTPQEVGISSNAWESEDAEVDLADEMKEEKCIINKLFNYESLEQLSYLQDQYQRMKVALAGPHATKPDKSLNVVKEELVEDIVLSLQGFKENVANMSKRVQGNSKQKAEKELKTESLSVGSRRQVLKNQAYAGSPSVRKQSLRSSPEKNIAVDKADRAAQRALGKSEPYCEIETDTDSESDTSEDSIVSPTRPPVKTRSSTSIKDHGRNLSMPILLTDDERDISSGDGSDDEYVPPSKKARGRKPFRQKIASRKGLQSRKSPKLPSPIKAVKAVFANSSWKATVSSTKMNRRRHAESTPSSSILQSVSDHSSPEETRRKTNSPRHRVTDKTDPETLGFRMEWSPLIKCRDSDEIASASIKRQRGRPSKYLKTFIENREGNIPTSKKSVNGDNYESEVFHTSSPQKQSIRNKRAKVSDNEEASMEIPPSKNKRNSCTDHGTNTSSVESLQDVPRTRLTNTAQKAKTPSSYDIVIKPMVRGRKADIFDNSACSKTDNLFSKNNKSLQPSHSGRAEEKKGPLAHADRPISNLGKCKDVVNREKLPNAPTNLTFTPNSGNELREQNVQIVNCANDTAKRKSSYKIILAPTASQDYADMGDNVKASPLQVKFPKVQFSHSIHGMKLKKDGQPKQSLFSKSLAAAAESSASAQLHCKNTDADMLKSSSNSSDVDNIPHTSKAKNGKNLISKEQNGGFSHSQSTCSSRSKSGQKDTAQRGELPKNQRDRKQDISSYIRKPRLSRYYNIPEGFGEEKAKGSATEPVLHQEKIFKAYKDFESRMEPKKEAAPECPTVVAMRHYRENLMRKSGATDTAERPKSKKLVLDCVKFL